MRFALAALLFAAPAAAQDLLPLAARARASASEARAAALPLGLETKAQSPISYSFLADTYDKAVRPKNILAWVGDWLFTAHAFRWHDSPKESARGIYDPAGLDKTPAQLRAGDAFAGRVPLTFTFPGEDASPFSDKGEVSFAGNRWECRLARVDYLVCRAEGHSDRDGRRKAVTRYAGFTRAAE